MGLIALDGTVEAIVISNVTTMFTNEVTPSADLYKIVRLTNKTDFDFTPEMGARYGGVPYPVPAGKSLLLPKPAAKLLAKHLARQVYIKNAPVYGPSEIDGKGSDRPLWTEEECLKLADSFLSDEYAEEKPVPQSEEQIIKEKVETLNRDFDLSEPVSPVKEEVTHVDKAEANSPTSFMDKAEVIAELTKRGIKFDARKSKSALEALLKE